MSTLVEVVLLFTDIPSGTHKLMVSHPIKPAFSAYFERQRKLA
jgi:hypothetical protein